jgi:hypothetical protein
MPIIDNPTLYDKVKEYADTIYSKPSAYKSGFIVKKYKELGGTYTDDNKPKNLKRWYLENWQNISNPNDYPVLRPTKRINKNTPLTRSEISPINLKKQIKLKQIYKGTKNLPPFKKINNNNMTQIIKIEKSNRLTKRFKAFFDDGKEINFGQEFSDGTHPQTYIDGASKEKRDAYIKRHISNKIEYELITNLIPSPSLLSMYILWYSPDINYNIEYLNSLIKGKYNIKK